MGGKMYQALVIQGLGRIKHIAYFDGEDEVYHFAHEESSPHELDLAQDDPHHYEKYDPPVVLVMEGTTMSDLENGKYLKPVAVFHRGMRWVCDKIP
jgi:hypothetical protein